jgi:hypothetical protein
MIKNLRTIAGAAVLTTALGLSVAACTSPPNAQQKEQAQQQGDTQSLINDQPIPHFNYSQIRQTAIDAETISAEGTQTTSFFFQLGDQDPVFSCPSLGEPVPNTAQLSNPEQVVGVPGNIGGGSTDLPQMDPNGIYAPAASSGTYVICVNSSGQDYLEYWEGDVMSVTSAATWDTSTHTIKVIGAPTAVIHTAANK